MTLTKAAETVAIHMRVRIRQALAEGCSAPSNMTLYAQGMRTELFNRGIITVEPHWRTIRQEFRKLQGK
jgi:hypothetical protein